MSHAEPRSVVELLAAAVSIDTVNPAIAARGGGESKLVDYLAGVAAAFGFSARRLPVAGYGENLLVVFDQGRDRPWLLFDSHLDTVGVEGMVIDPFAAEIRGGRLWGRGACDTKASGAAMLWALVQYAQSGGGPNNVAILFSVDEEVGMRGITSFIANDYHGFGRAGVVVGEPTGLRLVVAHNGVFRARVKTHGIAAHSSNPSAGRSAISAMAKIVTGLEEGYIAGLAFSHELTGSAQCSINTIRGGTAANVIPDLCEVEIDRRMVPGERAEEVARALRAALEAVKRRSPEIDYEMITPFSGPPLMPKAGSRLIDAARGALSAEGLPDGPIGVTYATNGGELSAAGIDAVVLGPGDIAQAHTREEWLDLAELERGVRVYRGIMARG